MIGKASIVEQIKEAQDGLFAVIGLEANCLFVTAAFRERLIDFARPMFFGTKTSMFAHSPVLGAVEHHELLQMGDMKVMTTSDARLLNKGEFGVAYVEVAKEVQSEF